MDPNPNIQEYIDYMTMLDIAVWAFIGFWILMLIVRFLPRKDN